MAEVEIAKKLRSLISHVVESPIVTVKEECIARLFRGFPAARRRVAARLSGEMVVCGGYDIDRSLLPLIAYMPLCLTLRRRYCVAMRLVGYGYEDVGRILAITKETVRSHLKYSRTKMRAVEGEVMFDTVVFALIAERAAFKSRG